MFSLLLMLEDFFQFYFASDCLQHQGEEEDLVLFPLIFPGLPGHGLCSVDLSTGTFTFLFSPSTSFSLEDRNSDSGKVNSGRLGGPKDTEFSELHMKPLKGSGNFGLK